MTKEKFVNWEHVKVLIKLMQSKESIPYWESTEKEDKKIQNTIAWLERNAKEIEKSEEDFEGRKTIKVNKG